MKFFAPILVVLFLTACTQTEKAPATTEVAAPEATNGETYTYEDIEGSSVKRVTLKNRNEKILEHGFEENGQRTGMWTVFDRSKVFPKKIISYQNGMYNGPYYEFTERGQLDVKAYYTNNKLDGYYAKYKFSKEVVTVNYKNGKRDGEYKEFDDRKNFLTKLETYKNGVLHGKVTYYNESGVPIMDYEYKDGEKISGGIINGGE